MNILLDTHILLWYLTNNPKLSDKSSEIIDNPSNNKYFSIASLWEIAIKTSIGKLTINQPIMSIIPNEIHLLPITITHIAHIEKLTFHHRDPFDRMIIAQAITENLLVMSRDKNFKYYNINLIAG